jgi:predicted phosphodiesterase
MTILLNYRDISVILVLSDSPLALAMSALEAIPALTGTNGTGFAWTIYTGDLVSHDSENQLSRCVPVFPLYRTKK